ncbi:MAG TPA: hypothetical protein GXZ85_11495 [Firmicutes bacterium]|nr:hypothetical protein [Bacillota bacterium]
MRSIRRRYTCSSLLLALSVFCTLWLNPRQTGTRILWSSLIVFLVGLFIRQSQMLQTAKLIWDNRVLVIAEPWLDKSNRSAMEDEETVLSTFGMLSAGHIYEWGRRGLWGVRLKTMDVDQKKMRLSFGDKSQAIWFEFAHGIDTQQKIREVTQTLWRETGVKTTIQDS